MAHQRPSVIPTSWRLTEDSIHKELFDSVLLLHISKKHIYEIFFFQFCLGYHINWPRGVKLSSNQDFQSIQNVLGYYFSQLLDTKYCAADQSITVTSTAPVAITLIGLCYPAELEGLKPPNYHATTKQVLHFYTHVHLYITPLFSSFIITTLFKGNFFLAVHRKQHRVN